MTDKDNTEPKIVEAIHTVKFTDRQIEIMRHWAGSKSASEASTNLGISEHTYQTHLKRMRAKLKVNRTFDVFRHLQEREII